MIIVLTFGFYVVYTPLLVGVVYFTNDIYGGKDIVVPIATAYASRYKQRLRNDTIENLSAWIIFMCGIFGFYIVRAQRCL